MKVQPTPFEGLYVIEPRIFQDARGYFFESWNKKTFAGLDIPAEYVQDNQSGSVANVIRGLHFQVPPHAQGKLVRVLKGAVLDVVVDLRRNQPTYGKHFKIMLEAGQHKMVFIPEGFAHGFRTLQDDTVFFYKCTSGYHKAAERTIRWDDPELQINWETDDPLLSEKDRTAPLFSDFDSPF